jgi:hypothetical protein
LAFILKELAGVDKLRAMKLAPAPNNNKANAVSKYRSILRGANDSWDGESSYADSTSYNGSDSSQEKSLSVKHHRDKKRSGKSSRSSKRSSDLSSSNSSSKEERKPKKKAVEATCKHCKKYGKKQHPEKFSTDQCMWNKKAVCFRYTAECKQMQLKYIKGHEFKRGKEDKWPKHKAKAPKEDKKEDNND